MGFPGQALLQGPPGTAGQSGSSVVGKGPCCQACRTAAAAPLLILLPQFPAGMQFESTQQS